MSASRIVDELRKSIGKLCRILSSYRSPENKRAVGGTPLSQHKQFTALAIAIDGISPLQVYDRLIERRKTGKFTGGTDLYPSSGFVRIETRGRKANWREW